MNIERRFNADIQAIREEGGVPTIKGYATVWDVIVELWPGQFEVWRRGAFKRAIKNGADVRCLFNHDVNHVLARIKTKTLELLEDAKGLFYRATLDPNDSGAMADFQKIKTRLVDQSSFAFEVEKNGEKFTDVEGGRLREVTRSKIFDVSPVTYPAFETTEVEACAKVAFRNAPTDTNSDETNEPQQEEKHSDPRPVSHSLSLLRRRLNLRERE